MKEQLTTALCKWTFLFAMDIRDGEVGCGLAYVVNEIHETSILDPHMKPWRLLHC